MENLDTGPQNGQIFLGQGNMDVVPEAVLRESSKGLTKRFPRGPQLSHDVVEGVKNEILIILKTAGHELINSAHRAAACNAIYAFLEQGVISECPELHDFSVSSHIFRSVLSVYLDKADHAKGKSMKQLLVALGMMITRNRDHKAVEDLKKDAINSFATILLGHSARTKLKAAVQALEYFLSKDLVTVQFLVCLFEQNTRDHRNQGSYERGITETITPGQNAGRLPFDSVESLTELLLQWIVPADTSPAGGNLIRVLFSKLQKQESNSFPFYDSITHLPRWIDPLQSSIRQYPDALENYRHHAFPGLFKISISDHILFLKAVGLEELFSQRVITNDIDVLMLFSALQVSKELGFLHESPPESTESITCTPLGVELSDAAVGDLLAHKSSTIRLASLNLLATSPSLTKPLGKESLLLLRDNLLSFHVDTDAKNRMDLLSTTKQILDRIHGSTSYIQRQCDSIAKCRLHEAKGSYNHMESLPGESKLREILHDHRSFLDWYIHSLFLELGPTVSYQRHITALKALTILLKTGIDPSVPANFLSRFALGDVKWPENFRREILTPTRVRVLLDLFLDPFDDVRNAAGILLKMSTTETEALNTFVETEGGMHRDQGHYNLMRHQYLVSAINKAENLVARTGRADHSDGLARLYETLFHFSYSSTDSTLGEQCESRIGIVAQLLSKLRQQLNIARHNFGLAISQHPVHGRLAALRYILERPDFFTTMQTDFQDCCSLQSLLPEAVDICSDVWTIVRPVLCTDSPEGHIPDEIEPDNYVGTKDILSYSWRALKEASSLLRTIISGTPYGEVKGCSWLKPEYFRIIGELSLEQLSELRHRGAFSTVSMTFAISCQRCIKLSDCGGPSWLTSWYRETISCIEDKASTITRRSAGIPSLLVGVLSADPGSEFFHQAIKNLEKMARAPVPTIVDHQESRLPQVHALNCLKEVFSSSKLGSDSEAHISDCLDLAVSCLTVNIWAIRNCGMMLLRALIDRLFGTNDSQDMTDIPQSRPSKLSYKKYNNLPGLLLRLLGSEVVHAVNAITLPNALPQEEVSQTVFPALEILRRAGLPSKHSTDIRNSVRAHLRSRSWHVRDMAARTYSSFFDTAQYSEEIIRLLEESKTSTNQAHGGLLCVLYLLQNFFRGQDDQISQFSSRKDISSAIISSCLKLYKSQRCSHVRSAIVQILNCWTRNEGFAIVTRLHGDSVDSQWFSELQALVEKEYSAFQNANLSNSRDVDPFKYSPLLHDSTSVFLCSWDYILERNDLLQRRLVFLAAHDENSTCSALEALNAWTGLVSSVKPMNTVLALAEAYTNIMDIKTSATVKTLATRNLTNLTRMDHSVAKEVQLRFLIRGWQLNAKYLSDKSSINPSVMDAELRLRGSLLFTMLAAATASPRDNRKAFFRWITTVSLRQGYNTEYTVRFAAAESLYDFLFGHSHNDGSLPDQDCLLDTYSRVYDALNDDDDDVRDKAADLTSWVVSQNSLGEIMMPLMPLAASAKLSTFIMSEPCWASHACILGMRKVTGLREQTGSVLSFDPNSVDIFVFDLRRPVKELYLEARKEDTSLFVEEKQNLFIDEVREAELWFHGVANSPFTDTHTYLMPDVEAWVSTGLEELLDIAEYEPVGCLDWTVKPEVFALGLHFIFTAGTILRWKQRGMKWKVDLLPQLERIWKSEKAIHPFWALHSRNIHMRYS